MLAVEEGDVRGGVSNCLASCEEPKGDVRVEEVVVVVVEVEALQKGGVEVEEVVEAAGVTALLVRLGALDVTPVPLI